MTELFDRDVKTIGKHINNALNEELQNEESTVAKFATVQMEGEREVLRDIYFVTKNHSFLDGNKRIAATMFLYFLDKNQALFIDGQKKIEDSTLVALTIMIAESKPEEKEMMISVVMNCMQ